MAILSLNNISFSYNKTPVLHNLSYEFEKGQIYCIMGKSGAGKTTLLSLLSGLASPNSGSIMYKDKDIKKIDKYKFRSKYIGVIFQSFNLLTKFTALENVMLSMDIAHVKESDKKAGSPRSQNGQTDCAFQYSCSRPKNRNSLYSKKAKALELLKSVGLSEDEANRRILKLSGGQQQRVAIARALSYDSEIILADEPTGNLDGDTQNEIMGIFRELANNGKCVILVSHSPEVAKMCDQCYQLVKHK